MFIDNFLPQDALVVDNFEDAVTIQRILLDNGNCVMLSREENLWCINWVWTEKADRNDVIFIDRGEYEAKEWAWLKKHPEYGNEE